MKHLLIGVMLLLAGGAQAQTFTLKSKDLGGQATQKEFFNGWGCTGSNISPQLYWEHAPAGTQSFAITIYDKDAPTGSGFWHWIVYNLPATSKELPAGAGDLTKKLLPVGAANGKNDFGQLGYGGPCPPAGSAHQYLITVYALKSKLDLDANASAAVIGFNLNAHSLGQASIVMYGQTK